MLQKILSDRSRHTDTHLLQIFRLYHDIRLQIEQNPHALFRSITIHIYHEF